MTALPIPVDLKAGGISRDYATIFEDLLRLTEHYTPEWTYKGHDDFGVVLLQLFSYLADHLYYGTDTTLRDTSLATAIDIHLVRLIGERVGYFVKRPAPAQIRLQFTVTNPINESFTLPQHFRVETPAGIGFELAAPYFVPALTSAFPDLLLAQEGKLLEDVAVGVATGAKFEKFVLNDSQAIFNQEQTDLTVLVGGEEATYVKYPVFAESDRLHYWVRELRDGTLQLRFGDGSYGKLLSAGSLVTVSYRRGGGRAGLVQAGVVTEIQSMVVTDGGTPVSLDVTNPQRSFGGNERETIDSARFNVEGHFVAQNRAVTKEDYELAAIAVSGIFQASAVRMGINGVFIYVVTDDAFEGGVLDSILAAQVVNAIDDVRMSTDVITVASAFLVPIDVTLSIVTFPRDRNAVVKERVRVALEARGGVLHSLGGTLGKSLRLSDMINIIEDVMGVDYVDVLRYARRPELRWVYRSGNAELSADGITITDRTTEEILDLAFVDPTTFKVLGRTSGAAGVGTVGAIFSLTGNELSFTLEAGTISMSEGDRAEIYVSRLAWNIGIHPFEFPIPGEIVVRVTGGIE